MTGWSSYGPDRLEEAQNALLARDWALLIGGWPARASSGQVYDDVSPINGRLLARVPDGTAADADAAADAAAGAAPGWAAVPPRQRADAVRAMADAIERNADELALIDCLDIGACIGQMHRDVAHAVEQLRMFAGLALEQKGQTFPVSENVHYSIREPYGVVARIIPFNHPMMFAASKIAAPLIAGNAVVLKPPDIAPLSALRLGELFADLLPPGVLSVVVGDGPAVPRAVVRHPAVRRIGFIGSEPTGRSIVKDAADAGVKTVTLELGGKNALIAFADSDPTEVAAGAVAGMNFSWSGQSCGSTSRLLVHEDIADAVVEAVRARIGRLRIGSPLDPACDVGTMASRPQYDKSLRHIEQAREDGAVVLTGGGPPAGLADGLYVAPTLLDGVTTDMAIANQEVFGPVLSVLRFTGEDEAVAVANSVPYGLTASIWTNDVKRAHRVAGRVEAGYVWVNGAGQHFLGTPYGGVKSSGVGREESLDELLSHTDTKCVHIFL